MSASFGVWEDWRSRIGLRDPGVVDEVFFGLAWRPNPRVLDWMEAFFQRHEVLTISVSAKF